MGKHFSDLELDQVLEWGSQGMAPRVIHDRLARGRSRARDRGPNLRAVQRALKGVAFKRAKLETRGRKKVLSPANLRASDRARRRLIEKADGECEVHWGDTIRAARVPHVDRTTAAKSMKAAG